MAEAKSAIGGRRGFGGSNEIEKKILKRRRSTRPFL
jgi:hypothetical protein